MAHDRYAFTGDSDRHVPSLGEGWRSQIAAGATDGGQRSGDRDRDNFDLTNRLLIQVPADQAEHFSPSDDDRGGIVVSGAGALIAADDKGRETSWPVLADRRRYAGKNRPRGTVRFDPFWIDRQRELKTATVLTDSGYVGEGDVEALVAILGKATRAGENVCAVLPLHISWLADPGVKLLTREVNRYEVPAALVLEHSTDPLGAQYAVRGLKQLLSQTQVPVSLLCTDISGLGAIAHGAAWAAVGITAALRHLYPADKKGPPFKGSPARHAIGVGAGNQRRSALDDLVGLLSGHQAKAVVDSLRPHGVPACDLSG